MNLPITSEEAKYLVESLEEYLAGIMNYSEKLKELIDRLDQLDDETETFLMVAESRHGVDELLKKFEGIMDENNITDK